MKTKSTPVSVFLLLMLVTISWAIPVPDTGQTTCFDDIGNMISCPTEGQDFYGQDANLVINPPSYTKLDIDGNPLPTTSESWSMVKDNVTGLVWEVKTNRDDVSNYNDPHDADNTYTWYDSNPVTNGGNAGTPGDGTDTEDFIRALNDSSYGGYSDWRLPTDTELADIVDYSIPYPGPAIDTRYFPNTAASWYWTAATLDQWTENAWLVHFDYSYVHAYLKSNSLYVRAVRGGQGAEATYRDNGDGTVTDTKTGLTWQQTAVSGKTWAEALTYCENLTLGGQTDWRLPGIKELRSLIDTSRHDPAINSTHFPDAAASWYWSGTTCASHPQDAWVVNFYFGDVDGFVKTDGIFVRAVRGGQVGSDPGMVQTSLQADQVADLVINSTNRHGDSPVYEWLLFTATVAGQPVPVYLISDIGIFELNLVLPDLYEYTFTCDADDVTLIARMPLSDLGLTSGDMFTYAYAYENPDGGIIIDNVVFITVQ
ncbi:MAG: DUF1566 domain-containing protein [Desulfatirhabdiaceae bacterium]